MKTIAAVAVAAAALVVVAALVAAAALVAVAGPPAPEDHRVAAAAVDSVTNPALGGLDYNPPSSHQPVLEDGFPKVSERAIDLLILGLNPW